MGGRRYTVAAEDIRPNDCYDTNTGLPIPADMAILVLNEPIPNAVAGTDYVEVYNAGVSGDMVNKTFTLVGWGDFGPAGGSTSSGDANLTFHAG